VLNSDAHTLNAVGRNAKGDRRITRYKMEAPSFEGLRIAFKTADTRVRIEEELPAIVPMIQGVRLCADGVPTAGAQNATLQERGLSPEVPLNARRRLQHFQRPTPSHVSSISSRATRRGDDHVARGRRGGLKMRKA